MVKVVDSTTDDRIEIRISGKGGQGVIKAGIILAKAAMNAGFNVTQMQSYGPEVRGGNCISDVVISKDEIDYPGVTKIDILVSMAQKAYEANVKHVRPGGVIVVDSGVQLSVIPSNTDVCVLPIVKLAREVGSELFANSVALGALAAILNINKHIIINTMKEELPKEYIDSNLKAFEKGYNKFARVFEKNYKKKVKIKNIIC